MIDPCIPTIARVTRFMSARAWRGFLASHPGWHVPALIGPCTRAAALGAALFTPGASLPGHYITAPARSGVVTPRLPGSVPSAGSAQEEGTSGIGAAEMAGGANSVAIAAGGYPAPWLAGGGGIEPLSPVVQQSPGYPALQGRMTPVLPSAFVVAPEPVAVPEPASVGLLGAGLVLIGLLRRKR